MNQVEYSNAHPHSYFEKSLNWEEGESKRMFLHQGGWREWLQREKLLVGGRQAGRDQSVLAWAAALRNSHLWLPLQFDVDHWGNGLSNIVIELQVFTSVFSAGLSDAVIWTECCPHFLKRSNVLSNKRKLFFPCRFNLQLQREVQVPTMQNLRYNNTTFDFYLHHIGITKSCCNWSVWHRVKTCFFF